MNKMLLSVCLIASTFSANLALAKVDYSQLPFPNKCEEVTSLVHVNEANRVLCRQSAIIYGLDSGLIKTKEDEKKPEIVGYYKKCFLKLTAEAVPSLAIDQM